VASTRTTKNILRKVIPDSVLFFWRKIDENRTRERRGKGKERKKKKIDKKPPFQVTFQPILCKNKKPILK